MHTKRFPTFFKIWVQSRVGALPRLPNLTLGNYFLTKNLIHILEWNSNYYININVRPWGRYHYQ